jgi:hypothetical protein
MTKIDKKSTRYQDEQELKHTNQNSKKSNTKQKPYKRPTNKNWY